MGNIGDTINEMMQNIQNQYYDTWMSRLAPSEQDIADMIGRLTRSVGTSQREGYNRAGELSAQYNLPVGAELALKRGTDIDAEKAISEGTSNINQYASQAKRQAWGTLFNADLTREGWQRQEDMQNESWWANLLQGVGSAVPFFFDLNLGGSPVEVNNLNDPGFGYSMQGYS